MGEWAWAAGICPLTGPARYGATQFVYAREGGFDPAKQLAVLSKHGVSNVFTTPTAMRAMMAIEDAGERFPQRFRIVCSAGEPLNPEAIRWFREQYGVTVLDFYGLTESYPLCANFPFMEVREGSMGKPMPGWQVAILDEDEREVAQGERGEICLRARTNPHYPPCRAARALAGGALTPQPSTSRLCSGPSRVIERRETPGSSRSRCVAESPRRRRSSCSAAIGRHSSSTTSVGSPEMSSIGRS